MYPRYNIPQTRRNMQTSGSYYGNYNNGDRFIAGGFLGPFILGGIAGSLITNRPNYGYGPVYGPPPPPIIYYPPQPVPTPYYSSTSYNYY